MPQVGFLCEVTCEPVSFDDCLACAKCLGKQQPSGGGEPRHCVYMYPHIHAIAHPYDRSKAGVSTTQLTGECTRKTWYEKRRDYYNFPSKSEASLIGTGYHELMDRHTEEEAVREVRLAKSWQFGSERREITGQMDYYRPDIGVLADYKVKKKVFTKAPHDYTAQLNIYAWMIRTGCVILETGEVLQGPVNEMFLSPHQNEFVKPTVDPKPGMVPVSMWTNEQTEAFVNIVYSRLVSGELPPRGMNPSDYSNKFCQGWCPFYKECLKAGGEIVTPPYNIAQLLAFSDVEF